MMYPSTQHRAVHKPATLLFSAFVAVGLLSWLSAAQRVSDVTDITDHYLRSLTASADTQRIYINNPLTVDTSLTLPANLQLSIGPAATITTLPGVTFEVLGDYAAPPAQEHLAGEGWIKLPHVEVFPDWFGARPNATRDAEYRLTVQEVVPNAHYIRKALFAAGPYGRLRFARSGVYESRDDAYLRRVFAGNFGREDFKERKGALELNPRFEGDGLDYSLDGITVRGQGKTETFIACPNEDELCVGFVAARYRHGGWDFDPDSVFTYGAEVAQGQNFVVPRTPRGLELAAGMDRVMVVNGASYYDQENGQLNRGARVDGDRVVFDYPFERNLGADRISNYGRTLEPFTAPAEGETVRIRAEKPVGTHFTKTFSIENDFYAVVSDDGDNWYTVRNLAGHGNAVGRVYPAGSRTSQARVIVPLRMTPVDQVVEDIAVIGRYDGAQVSNIIDLTFRRCLIVQSAFGRRGLTINGDGSLNVNFTDCTIIGVNTNGKNYGQLGRSTTNMRFDRCLLHPLEVSEFSTHTQIYDSEIYFDGPLRDSFADLELLSVGRTSGRTELVRTHLRGRKVLGLIGSRDIQVYGSTAGGGFLVRDVTAEADSVREMFKFDLPGVNIDGLRAYGNARSWVSRFGANPSVGGKRDRHYAPDARPVSRMRNASFVGRLNQVIGGYWGAADAEFSVFRTGYFYREGPEKSAYSRFQGTLIDRRGPGDPTYLRVEGLIDGWTVDEERDEEIQYPATLTVNSCVRLTLQNAELYDQRRSPTGQQIDTTFQLGSACTPATGPVWQTGSFIPDGTQGSKSLELPTPNTEPNVLLTRTDGGKLSGKERVSLVREGGADTKVVWAGLEASAVYRVRYTYPSP